jgi:hypothetical protein
LKEVAPHVPHLQANETFAYLFAYERENEFKPTKHYITFDFETMKQKVNEDKNIISIIKTLSIAATSKSKQGIQSIYSDDKDGEDFIKNVLKNSLSLQSKPLATMLTTTNPFRTIILRFLFLVMILRNLI